MTNTVLQRGRRTKMRPLPDQGQITNWKTVVVRLPEEVFQRMRALCFETSQTHQAFVFSALTEKLDRLTAPKRRVKHAEN